MEWLIEKLRNIYSYICKIVTNIISYIKEVFNMIFSRDSDNKGHKRKNKKKKKNKINIQENVMKTLEEYMTDNHSFEPFYNRKTSKKDQKIIREKLYDEINNPFIFRETQGNVTKLTANVDTALKERINQIKVDAKSVFEVIEDNNEKIVNLTVEVLPNVIAKIRAYNDDDKYMITKDMKFVNNQIICENKENTDITRLKHTRLLIPKRVEIITIDDNNEMVYIDVEVNSIVRYKTNIEYLIIITDNNMDICRGSIIHIKKSIFVLVRKEIHSITNNRVNIFRIMVYNQEELDFSIIDNGD